MVDTCSFTSVGCTAGAGVTVATGAGKGRRRNAGCLGVVFSCGFDGDGVGFALTGSATLLWGESTMGLKERTGGALECFTAGAEGTKELTGTGSLDYMKRR